MGRFFVSWLFLGLAGCGAPTQYGGPIPVEQEGLAGRMTMLCRVDPSKGMGCMAPAEGSEHGNVHVRGSGTSTPGK